MSEAVLSFILLLFSAAGPEYDRSEVGEQFATHLLEGDMSSAESLLAEDVTFANTSNGAVESLASLAKYARSCPFSKDREVKSDQYKIWLDCDQGGWDSITLEFADQKIRSVTFGPAPANMRRFLPPRVRGNANG